MPDQQTETQPAPNLSTEPGEKAANPVGGTETQPAPNISTETQQEGDARSPSDTLDRGQSDSVEPDEMPGSAEDIHIDGGRDGTAPNG